MPDRVLVLDTETTGFSPYSDRIVEVGAVEINPRTGDQRRRFHRFVNPDRPIPDRVVGIHGITNERVRNEALFGAVSSDLIAFLRGATLAIHNSGFDVGMLNAELHRAGKPRLEDLGVRVVDTIAVARNIYPLLPTHSLGGLCRHLRVDLEERTKHGALLDALLLGQTLPKMAKDFDAWMTSSNGEYPSELQRFERELVAYCRSLSAPLGSEIAEAVDTELSSVATAQRWIDVQRAAVSRECEALVGDSPWCGKFLVAYREQDEWICWKAAAEVLLPPVDLSKYAKVTTSNVVTPHASQPVTDFLQTLEPVISRKAVAQSLNAMTRLWAILSEVRSSLAARRKGLRTTLLRYINSGYTPQHSTVKIARRTKYSYERAVTEHARGADLTPYKTAAPKLRLRPRSAEACETLFGKALSDKAA